LSKLVIAPVGAWPGRGHKHKTAKAERWGHRWFSWVRSLSSREPHEEERLEWCIDLVNFVMWLRVACVRTAGSASATDALKQDRHDEAGRLTE
jgi:hypothetical protein